MAISELRKFAKDQECLAAITGYCNDNPETTVLAHYRPGFFGMAMKPHDILGAHTCSACHDILDGRNNNHNIDPDDLDQIFQSAVIKTIQRITSKYEITLGKIKK